jgi:hypothetical protein
MNTIRKRENEFTETVIDDEIVIMHLDRGDFFALSGTAAAIWRLIDGTKGRDSLIEELSNDFDADPESVETDVDEFLEELGKAGLVAEE